MAIIQGRYQRVAGMVAASLVCAGPASAYSLYDDDNGRSVDFNVEIGVGLFNSEHAYSQVRTSDGNPTWAEGYAKYGFAAEYALPNNGSVYGALNLLSAANRGDGDAAGFSTGSEEKTDVEDAFVGWRSGNLFPALGEDGVDISFGSQNFVIGDGFLINGDSLNFGDGFQPLVNEGIAPRGLNRGGAYWLAARKAFARTAILKVGGEQGWQSKGFWLESGNKAQAEMSLAGLSLQYADPDYGTLGFTYLHGLDVDNKSAEFLGLEKRDGQDTVAVRGNSSLGVPDLDLRGEYVFQDNGDFGHDHAWYAEGSWTFSDVTWTPAIDYRYSHFSDGFDPLFFGFNRGYGTWFQGEVAANYAGPFNTASNVQQVKLSAAPRDDLSVGALYFNFSDTPDDRLNGYEVDLYAEWTVNDHLLISPVLGLYNPDYSTDDGGTQLGGADRSLYQQIIAVVTF